MPALPTEVLQSICEHSGKPVAVWPTPSNFELGTSSEQAASFSCSSRHFRSISIPYLFRRLRVRTAEEAMLIARSALSKYAVHLNIPTVDILTARRPFPSKIFALFATIKSIRISASTPSFFYAACTPLARLLGSAKALTTLELDCDPILESVDTMPILAGLIPALPSSLTTLRVTMPGGQPEYLGTETLLKALSRPCCLPDLTDLCLSMHMAPIFTSGPEKLAIALARRSASLRRITFVAPGRNPQRGSPLWDLVGSQNGTEMFGGFRQRVMGWEFKRDGQAEEDEIQNSSEGYSANPGGFLWDDVNNYN
ncbi:F-box-like domain protein [Ceratobasidium sp. AG-Ba]|nr:F-box-like domain protein [Ceratobasidium sp. AG-Ba]